MTYKCNACGGIVKMPGSTMEVRHRCPVTLVIETMFPTYEADHED